MEETKEINIKCNWPETRSILKRQLMLCGFKVRIIKDAENNSFVTAKKE